MKASIKKYHNILVCMLFMVTLVENSFAQNNIEPVNINDTAISKIDSLIEYHKKSMICENDSIMKKLSILEDKSNINNWLNIILPSSVGFITALIATFFAAYLNRSAEYKKYIFQKRIDIYHEFFTELNILYASASKLIIESHQQRNEIENPNQTVWDVCKIFTPVRNKASIIYFLLNKNDKSNFINIIDELNDNIINSCKDVKKYKFEGKKYINKLKELLDTTMPDVNV